MKNILYKIIEKYLDLQKIRVILLYIKIRSLIDIFLKI